MVKFVRKREGKLAEFDQTRITNAIRKAFQAVDAGNVDKAEGLSDDVVAALNETFGEDGVPTVEEIQDVVEAKLIEHTFVQVSKAYILYRQQHTDMRQLAFLLGSDDMLDGYLNGTDWRVRENANMNFSLQGLNNHLSSRLVAHYWLTKMYSPIIRDKHASGAFHIHDLAVLGTYCVGWDLRDLLLSGFGGVSQKIESSPAKHFRTILGQVVNFFFTLQGEAAGAQAFSSFDTYLALHPLRQLGLRASGADHAGVCVQHERAHPRRLSDALHQSNVRSHRAPLHAGRRRDRRRTDPRQSLR
jgi:ribonucleoside-triphosphate reductase